MSQKTKNHTICNKQLDAIVNIRKVSTFKAIELMQKPFSSVFREQLTKSKLRKAKLHKDLMNGINRRDIMLNKIDNVVSKLIEKKCYIKKSTIDAITDNVMSYGKLSSIYNVLYTRLRSAV